MLDGADEEEERIVPYRGYGADVANEVCFSRQCFCSTHLLFEYEFLKSFNEHFLYDD